MRQPTVKALVNIARTALLCSLLTLPTASHSAPGARTGQWQVTLIPVYFDSRSIGFEGGATADINADTGFGIGIGYNFSDHVELDFEIGTSNANYVATQIAEDGQIDKYNGNLYSSRMNLGLTYNFLASRLTPFVKGNLGLAYVDTGIPTGDFGTVCWWDPWWGYYCGPYARTYTTSELSYGADLGLRFDITSKLFVKGSAGKSYIDFDRSSTTDFTVYKFIIGFSFR